jgi:hypothetical protein
LSFNTPKSTRGIDALSDTRGLLVPSKVCSEGLVSVHAEDPHRVLPILVPLIKVFLMVDVEFLHTSLIDEIEPAKLQFTY